MPEGSTSTAGISVFPQSLALGDRPPCHLLHGQKEILAGIRVPIASAGNADGLVDEQGVGSNATTWRKTGSGPARSTDRTDSGILRAVADRQDRARRHRLRTREARNPCGPPTVWSGCRGWCRSRGWSRGWGGRNHRSRAIPASRSGSGNWGWRRASIATWLTGALRPISQTGDVITPELTTNFELHGRRVHLPDDRILRDVGCLGGSVPIKLVAVLVGATDVARVVVGGVPDGIRLQEDGDVIRRVLATRHRGHNGRQVGGGGGCGRTVVSPTASGEGQNKRDERTDGGLHVGLLGLSH